MAVDVQAAMARCLNRFRDVVCTEYAVKAEQFAKANAPWKDRTGNARRLLTGEVIEESNVLGVRVKHRVEYGPQLEKAHSAKYAILKPTIEALRQDFFRTAKDFFGGNVV